MDIHFICNIHGIVYKSKESSFVFISCVATADKQQSPIHIENFFHSGLISSNCILARLIYSVGFNSSLQVTNPQHIITTS